MFFVVGPSKLEREFLKTGKSKDPKGYVGIISGCWGVPVKSRTPSVEQLHFLLNLDDSRGDNTPFTRPLKRALGSFLGVAGSALWGNLDMRVARILVCNTGRIQGLGN